MKRLIIAVLRAETGKRHNYSSEGQKTLRA